MSNSDSDSHRQFLMDTLKNVQKKMENIKKPDEITIESNIDEEYRKKIYQSTTKKTPTEILAFFERGSNMDLGEYDFDEIEEKKLKQQLNKLKKMEYNIRGELESSD